MTYKDKEKKNQYQREWVAKRRSEFFADKVCVVCGSSRQLELDHIDPATKESHSIWSWSKARRDAELAKCQVLCRTHHEIKTAEENRERNGGLHHGTDTMYSKYGCRCFACKEARRIYKKEIRERRRLLGLPHW